MSFDLAAQSNDDVGVMCSTRALMTTVPQAKRNGLKSLLWDKSKLWPLRSIVARVKACAFSFCNNTDPSVIYNT